MAKKKVEEELKDPVICDQHRTCPECERCMHTVPHNHIEECDMRCRVMSVAKCVAVKP